MGKFYFPWEINFPIGNYKFPKGEILGFPNKIVIVKNPLEINSFLFDFLRHSLTETYSFLISHRKKLKWNSTNIYSLEEILTYNKDDYIHWDHALTAKYNYLSESLKFTQSLFILAILNSGTVSHTYQKPLVTYLSIVLNECLYRV